MVPPQKLDIKDSPTMKSLISAGAHLSHSHNSDRYIVISTCYGGEFGNRDADFKYILTYIFYNTMLRGI
jgi:hypothetical protein